MEEIASELKDKRRDVSLPSHLKATSEETLANEGVDKRQIIMAATERFISLANLFKLGTSDDRIIPALIFLHNILEVGSGLCVLLCAVLTRLSTVQPQHLLAIHTADETQGIPGVFRKGMVRPRRLVTTAFHPISARF